MCGHYLFISKEITYFFYLANITNASLCLCNTAPLPATVTNTFLLSLGRFLPNTTHFTLNTVEKQDPPTVCNLSLYVCLSFYPFLFSLSYFYAFIFTFLCLFVLFPPTFPYFHILPAFLLHQTNTAQIQRNKLLESISLS